MLLGNRIGHFLTPVCAGQQREGASELWAARLLVGTDRQTDRQGTRRCSHARKAACAPSADPHPNLRGRRCRSHRWGSQGPERARQSPKVAKPRRNTRRRDHGSQAPRGSPVHQHRALDRSSLSFPGIQKHPHPLSWVIRGSQRKVLGHSSTWLRVSIPTLLMSSVLCDHSQVTYPL